MEKTKEPLKPKPVVGKKAKRKKNREEESAKLDFTDLVLAIGVNI